MSLPRSEYPRPQFQRQDWLCLNGQWEFEIDPGDSGRERGVGDSALSRRIQVPFCPESKLSGVEYTDFMNAVWYRCTVRIPAEWQEKRVLLRFQAVDYDATVWVNGIEVGRHRGGFTPFACDITHAASPGESAVIVVRARDDHRALKPKGKQSPEYANHGCLYTRTTGIWQTVWMEPVPEVRLERPRITPDVGNRCFRIVQPVNQNRAGHAVRASLRDEHGEISVAEVRVDADFSPMLTLSVPEERCRLWQPSEPFLYDIDLELLDEERNVVDAAGSYAGLRSVTVDGKSVLINGERLFQRLVLDQGYYPDGIMTAPSDEALRRDIELAFEAGFNGARLHQKVFEERFLYHADRLGYLVWDEFGDWFGNGVQRRSRQGDFTSFVTQWLEVVNRDYSHPCIIGWCPLNETQGRIQDDITLLDDLTLGMFLATKAQDQSRPVLDTSGYSHRISMADVYDSHDYLQDAEELRQRHAGLSQGAPFVNENPHVESVPYRGQPYFISEFGGIGWNPEAGAEEASWGYGERPNSEEEFYQRFEELCSTLLDHPDMFAYCYTQLTDVFQEQNGIYKFDRGRKFDTERLRKVQNRQARFEDT